MGKTPKEKHGNERRRPYNYPRNAQAQTRNSSTESRNYSYPSGNVPRRIPVYNLQYQGISVPVPNQSYHYGTGRGYRGRLRGINKSLKPILGRQRRPDLRSKRVLSPLHKASTRKIMQAQTEVQESLPEKSEETSCPVEEIAAERIKNGPENCSSHEEDAKEVTVGKVENGNPEAADKSSDHCDTNGISDKSAVTEEDSEKIQHKPKSSNVKEKKTKKNAVPSKLSPKGKQSPKTRKEAKPEIEEQPETGNKEKEKLQNKKDVESRSQESSTPEIHPNVNIIHVNSPHTEISDMNDSVVEITNQDSNKSHDITPSTSAEESSSKSVDTHSIRDSPRRSTRLAIHQSSPKQRSPAKPDSSSVIILDSDDSISVLEISRPTQVRSFAQSLRSLSGRPSLRQLPAYNRSFNRPSTVGSTSIRSNISSRSGTTTGNDSESDSQETKILRPKSGLWGLFRTPSRNAPSQDSTTDNEELTNRSVVDDSGNDSEATTEPAELPSNLSFGKRKIRDAGLIDETEQENKRIRGENVGQKNNPNTSSGLFSIVSSPMNLFASKIMGDKAKSSTPVQMLKTSIVEEDTREDLSLQQDDVSDIQYEGENLSNLSHKESLTVISSKMDEDQALTPRRWCSIM